jgi:hypothetical protein
MFGQQAADQAAYERCGHLIMWPRQGLPARDWTPAGRLFGVVTYRPQRPRALRRGTKIWVDFGSFVGRQDTWWPNRGPLPKGVGVIVEAHWWTDGSTHSRRPVLWIDQWHHMIPAGDVRRAQRHERRLAKRSQH